MTTYVGSPLWGRVGRLFDALNVIGTDDAAALKSLLWQYEDAIIKGDESKFRAKHRDRIGELAAMVSGVEHDPRLEGAKLVQAVLSTFETSPT